MVFRVRVRIRAGVIGLWGQRLCGRKTETPRSSLNGLY